MVRSIALRHVHTIESHEQAAVTLHIIAYIFEYFLQLHDFVSQMFSCCDSWFNTAILCNHEKSYIKSEGKGQQIALLTYTILMHIFTNCPNKILYCN